MQILTRLSELRPARQALRGSFGLVPTRGALHPGKLSLVERARAECDHVGVSVFADQVGGHIGPPRREPDPVGGHIGPPRRELEQDLRRLEALGVDLVWAPSPAEAYPPDFQTWVTVEHASLPLEGKHRPGHFRAVATWTARLFNACTPGRAYFGQIDAQRVAVVRRMVTDLYSPVEIVVCPTVREADGLALSNRNASLSPPERAAATVLYRALSTAREAYIAGERDGDALRAILSSTLAAEPLAREEYVSVADPNSLDELERLEGGGLLAVAARVGKTRLIDNVEVG